MLGCLAHGRNVRHRSLGPIGAPGHDGWARGLRRGARRARAPVSPRRPSARGGLRGPAHLLLERRRLAPHRRGRSVRTCLGDDRCRAGAGAASGAPRDLPAPPAW